MEAALSTQLSALGVDAELYGPYVCAMLHEVDPSDVAAANEALDGAIEYVKALLDNPN